MYYTNSYNANLDVWDGSQFKHIICVWCLWFIWVSSVESEKLWEVSRCDDIHKNKESKKTSNLPLNFCSEVRKFVQKIQWRSVVTETLSASDRTSSFNNDPSKKLANCVNSYKSVGMNSEKYLSLKKWRFLPWPQITESVDKCTKNIEIQSQKRQYEIANMHNFVPNNSNHHPQKRIIRFQSNGIVNPLCKKGKSLSPSHWYLHMELLWSYIVCIQCCGTKSRCQISR